MELCQEPSLKISSNEATTIKISRKKKKNQSTQLRKMTFNHWLISPLNPPSAVSPSWVLYRVLMESKLVSEGFFPIQKYFINLIIVLIDIMINPCQVWSAEEYKLYFGGIESAGLCVHPTCCLHREQAVFFATFGEISAWLSHCLRVLVGVPWAWSGVLFWVLSAQGCCTGHLSTSSHHDIWARAVLSASRQLALELWALLNAQNLEKMASTWAGSWTCLS